MKRLIALILTLATLMTCAAMIPVSAGAEDLYIIRDSDRRELTRDELWGYQYDTLLYAFNEIYARHGYKFETGSRCYNWFTLMPWYKPNASESSSNHSESLNKTTALERKNVKLIKEVREEMRTLKTTNPGGKGMPIPPDQNIDTPRGFQFVSLQTGQKLAVYSAPSENAYRANNGKAAVGTDGAIYALGWDQGWLLMMYYADSAGQYRVGYVNGAKIKGKKPDMGQLSWSRSECEVLEAATLTDDLILTGKPLTQLAKGTRVTYLTTMYNSGAWDYIETTINGQTARGFIPSGCLSITGEDLTETLDPALGDG